MTTLPHISGKIIDAHYLGTHSEAHSQAPGCQVMAWLVQTSRKSKRHPFGAFAIVVNGCRFGLGKMTAESLASIRQDFHAWASAVQKDRFVA